MKPSIESIEALLLSKFMDGNSPITDRQKIRSAAVDIFHHCIKPEKTIDADTARRESAMDVSRAFTQKR